MSYTKIFLAVLVWDFLATLDVRAIAEQRWWAVPLAGVFALLWFVSTSWIVARPRSWPFVVLASMLGTAGALWL